MNIRILITPPEDYFVAFMATRGMHISYEEIDVIHFFGDSRKEIRKLYKKYDPDLVVIHNQKAFDLDYEFPFILDKISSDKDIYKCRQITTNSTELARLHYQRLGLERTVNEVKKEKKENKFTINHISAKKIFAAMMWE